MTSFAAVMLILSCVYISFNNSFLLDEYYDGTALHELTLSDKLTIRVQPKNIQQLQKFIQHYSQCPCVHEIKIILTTQQQQKESYESTPFIYEHTHSLVTFANEAEEAEQVKRRTEGEESPTPSSSSLWETESIMLLDSHVFVHCNDLKFTFSVWKSSVDALIGYFPRLHTSNQLNDSRSDSPKKPIPEEVLLEYLDWWYVLWHQRYSLMLPSAVLLKKEIWESYLGNSKEAHQLKAMVSSHPECSPVALSVWAAHTSPSPPIWVDIPVTVDPFTSSPSSSSSPSLASSSSSFGKSKTSSTSSPLSMSSCLTQISSLLHHPKLRYSFHKAAVAKNVLFW